MLNQVSRYILNLYKPMFDVPLSQMSEIGVSVGIPSLTKATLKKLLIETIESLKKGNTVKEMNHECVVVGDIHGNFHDLIRIFLINGLPPKQNYVFLGDYVDRGQYSLEVITLLFCLRNLYPESIILLRGNHELRETNKTYGFLPELAEVDVTTNLWSSFNDAFDYLPLAAVIQGKFFCVHGGISPYDNFLEELRKMRLPIRDVSGFVLDLLWSDPSDKIDLFDENKRGRGCLFGRQAIFDFIKTSGYQCIIRGHQFTEEGIARHSTSRVITVFSCTNYSGATNKGGYLHVDNTEIVGTTYTGLEFPNRYLAKFTYESPHSQRSVSFDDSSAGTAHKRVKIFNPLKAMSLSVRAFPHAKSSIHL